MSPLAEKMIALADTGHRDAILLRQRAQEFEAAVEAGDPRKLLGAWARARRTWCDATGEPLI